MAKAIIQASDVQLKIDQKIVLHSFNFQIDSGKALVITGSSGSGKTTLAKLIAGEIQPAGGKITVAEPCKRIFVSQQDQFISGTNLRSTHYGQRYENPNQEGIPTVLNYINKVLDDVEEETVLSVAELLEINYLLERKLLSLSNGERKRTQLVIALLQNPDLLILDQPYVGLDAHSRERLTAELERRKELGLTIVLVVDSGLIPVFADQVLELNDGRILQLVSRNKFVPFAKEEEGSFLMDDRLLRKTAATNSAFKSIVRMNKVDVKIGEKQVLQNINWEVKAGQKWALLGHNGAGKSTLLSLVTADNPQGYSNDLTLFDKKRGSGESIWDIKKRIGFVSPELHLYFLRGSGIYNTVPGLGKPGRVKSLSALEVVLSGYHDEIGLNSSKSTEQVDTAKAWLRLMKLEHLEKVDYAQASLGEQRTVLLGRALIKSPELLILDEPCQGLDSTQTRRFVNLLDHICKHHQTTLIYVTHRKEEIPKSVNHLLELENGRVKTMGRY